MVVAVCRTLLLLPTTLPLTKLVIFRDIYLGPRQTREIAVDNCLVVDDKKLSITKNTAVCVKQLIDKELLVCDTIF